MEKEFKIVTDYSVCKLCKGACCQSMPASYHPGDFERIFDENISVDLLVKIFNSGIVAVDWWEGDPRYEIKFDVAEAIIKTEDAMDVCYYLRPKGINALYELKDPSYRNNPCIHWNTEVGCTLSEFNRPYGCRTLVPNKNDFPYGCTYKPDADGSKQAMAIAWIPYQEMIEEAIEIYNLKKLQ